MRTIITFVATLAISFATFAVRAGSQFHHFITVRADQLRDGDRPFRFISFDIPNLLLIEDNLPFAEPNPWRPPNQFEIRDALATVRQMGGTVVRTYVIPVRRPADGPDVPKYVLGPGKFNERAFRTLDRLLQVANEEGVRLIIPLVDNWVWQGGRAEYAGFRGKTKDEFWTDPQLISDFKKTIRFVLTRTNTYTGVRYSDDPAILCWETGNELSSPPSWTRTIAAYLKRLDTNHLVMDGFNASVLRPESLAMPNIDIVTTHHYPGPRKSFSELIRENWAMAKGKKPYVVGEFGFVSTAQMEDTMKTIRDLGLSGGLLWSLRFHDRDGGFYWHSEPSGGNLYKAFHWPGSPMGDAYDEMKLMALVRSNAFAIRGLPVPPVPVPAPPRLLPIEDAAAISWQGSVGAVNYTVERAPEAGGPWTVVGPAIDESRVQYRPLFNDANAPGGEWFYRVRANNASGSSEPSNVAGPVKVTHDALVDELADFSQVFAKQGNWELKTHDCRKAKEDATRAAGNAGDELTYRLPTAIEGFRVFVFFPNEVADLKFSVSNDGQTYRTVDASKESYFQGAGDYGYWKPVLYHSRNLGAGATFLKIELTGETQIGRVEITRALPKN